jgi:hypothetical protein
MHGADAVVIPAAAAAVDITAAAAVPIMVAAAAAPALLTLIQPLLLFIPKVSIPETVKLL